MNIEKLKTSIKCLIGLHIGKTEVITYNGWYALYPKRQLVKKCIYCCKILKEEGLK